MSLSSGWARIQSHPCLPTLVLTARAPGQYSTVRAPPQRYHQLRSGRDARASSEARSSALAAGEPKVMTDLAWLGKQLHFQSCIAHSRTLWRRKRMRICGIITRRCALSFISVDVSMSTLPSCFFKTLKALATSNFSKRTTP